MLSVKGTEISGVITATDNKPGLLHLHHQSIQSGALSLVETFKVLKYFHSVAEDSDELFLYGKGELALATL